MPDFTESGPRFNSFGGGEGAAGGILGVNQLQDAVDTFARTVDKLSAAAKLLATFRNPQTGQFVSQNDAALGGFPAVQPGVFATFRNPQTGRYMTQNAYASAFQAVSPYNAAPAAAGGGAPAMGGTLGSAAAPAATFGQMAGIGGGGMGIPPTGVWAGPGSAPGGWTWNARFGPPNTGPPAIGGPPAPPGAGGGGNMGGTLGAAQTIGMTLNALASRGVSNMSSQVALNTYQYGGQLLMNGGNYAGNQTLLARNALGTAGTFGGGQMLNDLAFNPTDALQMYAILQQMSGSAVVGNNYPGLTATAGFSYLNPALSGTQAAQAAQQMYQPGTSLSMLMSGLPISALPRAPVTGQMRSMPTVLEGMLGALFPRGTSTSNIAQNLQPGGLLNNELQQYGMNPSTYATPLEAINDLAMGNRGQARMNPGQINQLFAQLGGKNVNQQNAAKATMSRYGINVNDLDTLKALAGTQSAGISDTSAGFTTGLQAATRALGDFRTGLYKVLNSTGLAGPLGFGQGAMGTLGSFGGLGGLGGGLGAGLLISRLLGGGGIGGTGGILGRGILGGGGGGGAGGIGLGTLAAAGGAAAGGAGIGWLINLLGAHLSPAGSPQGNVARAFQGSNMPSSVTGSAGIISWLGNKLSGLFGGGSMTVGVPTGASQPKGNTKNVNTVSTGVSMQAKEAVAAAETKLGDPYQWGGTGPNAFDCSGLTQWAYQQAGVNLPRTSQEQWSFLQKRSIALNKVEEGDLVFATSPGDGGTFNAPGHVAMMISNNRLIQAPHTGADIEIIPYQPGAWTHAGRPSGSLNGGGGGGNLGTPAAIAAALMSMVTGTSGSAHGALGGTSPGLGDNPTGGSVQEGSAFQSAIMGGITAGSGNYGNPGTVTALATTAALTKALAAATGTSTTGSGGKGSIAKGGTAAQNQAIAAGLFSSYGWGTANGSNVEWNDLLKLWTQESGWSNTANNPSSGAYGIAQALPPTKYPVAGRPPWLGGTSNAGTQVTWGMQYIKGRYGDPAGAWAHEVANNWYAAGGVAGAGQVAVVGERGPEIVRMGQQANVISSAQSARLLQSAVAEGPYKATPSTGLNYSQLHPAFAGGTGMNAAGHMTLNFGSNSIVVNMPVTTSAGALTTGASARTVATQIVDQLQKMDIYKAIATGANS